MRGPPVANDEDAVACRRRVARSQRKRARSLNSLQELSLTEARAASVHSLHVEGQVGVVGASQVGRRLLTILNDGSYRVLLDLSRAEPIAPAALVGTLLRIDRYARAAAPGSSSCRARRWSRRSTSVRRADC